MNPSKSGLSTMAGTGIVVVLIVLVLGGVYLAPSLLKGGSISTSTISSQTCVSNSNIGSNQTFGLVSLFGCFSQMQIQDTLLDQGQGMVGAVPQQLTFSYHVLGQAPFGSTQDIKVDFSQLGGNHEVVAWFSPGGIVDRLDIIGDRNYTGPGAAIFAQTFTSAFSAITTVTNNATLLSSLSKTSQNATSIGPTRLDVTTYHLAVPAPPYKSITAKYATIPGTYQRLAVYLDEKMTDGTEKTFQILSLAK